MYYLRARYYNPQSGRFISADPFGGYDALPQTLHRYAYCGNDPVNRSDPGGLSSLAELEVGEGIAAENQGVLDGLFAGALRGGIGQIFTGGLVRTLQGGVIGGAVGGGVDAVRQLIVGKSFDWKEFGNAVGMGAAFGAAEASGNPWAQGAASGVAKVLIAQNFLNVVKVLSNPRATVADQRGAAFDLSLLALSGFAGSHSASVVESADSAAALAQSGDLAGADAALESGLLEAESAAVETSRALVERPSGYREGLREEVFNEAKDPVTGLVTDPYEPQTFAIDDKWQMGHKEGYEFRKLQQTAREQGWTRKEFLDAYNDPNTYQPQTRASNSSGLNEAPDNVNYWTSWIIQYRLNPMSWFRGGYRNR